MTSGLAGRSQTAVLPWRPVSAALWAASLRHAAWSSALTAVSADAESRCCCCSCCSCCCPVCPLLLRQRFLGQPEIPVETAVRVYRRYLQLEPTHAEEFIAYLKSKVRTHPWAHYAGMTSLVTVVMVGGNRAHTHGHILVGWHSLLTVVTMGGNRS